MVRKATVDDLIKKAAALNGTIETSERDVSQDVSNLLKRGALNRLYEREEKKRNQESVNLPCLKEQILRASWS